uniref:Uncharacterized protein LOC114346429 n=1 Tax=Diabrotica virgifera virgifera TaxID=50390 RepID=A0A6P7H373_DIAVI
MESYDIRLKRTEYLKQLIKFRSEGRNIIYTNETYIHSSHTPPYYWGHQSGKTSKKPISKGKRLIIVHAGEETGFVPNALLIFKSGSKSGDYHDDMNHLNFMKYVRSQLLPNLPKNSVLVVDNASYHNVTMEKNVTSGSRKDIMVKWLQEKSIPFPVNLTKPELYKIIQVHKPRFPPVYVLDHELEQHGHKVLRLPPYHPELNPIEKIWALVKGRVASHNTTCNINDVENIRKKKFSEVLIQ